MQDAQSRIFFSPGRLWTISRNTMTEVIRQKFFYILAVFGIAVLLSSIYFSQFSSEPGNQTKFIKDFGLAAIKVFGTLIAMVGTAQLLPLELENRTIYPILAKPVFRIEFLFGKYVGMMTLLLLTISIMTTIFAGVLFYTEHQMTTAIALGEGLRDGESPADSIRQVLQQTRDPNILKAITLIYFQVAMVSAITLLITTFATSVIFTVITTVMIYICGHLESTARGDWVGEQSWLIKILLVVITFFIPDLSAFDIVDQVVTGQHVAIRDVLTIIGYGIFYTAIILLGAHFVFNEKEI
jgi:hypothetical protein